MLIKVDVEITKSTFCDLRSEVRSRLSVFDKNSLVHMSLHAMLGNLIIVKTLFKISSKNLLLSTILISIMLAQSPSTPTPLFSIALHISHEFRHLVTPHAQSCMGGIEHLNYMCNVFHPNSSHFST